MVEEKEMKMFREIINFLNEFDREEISEEQLSMALRVYTLVCLNKIEKKEGIIDGLAY